MPFPPHLLPLLRCPACQGALAWEEDRGRCQGPGCGLTFPVRAGIPVLVDDARSLFSREAIVAEAAPGTPGPGRRPWARALLARLPSLSHNLAAAENYRRFARELLARNPRPRVLVVGGGTAGEGCETLLQDQGLEVLESDVWFGPRTSLVCDAHDLPFAAGTFDGVVAQAVLEHVLDPWRCVQEIHRVLAPGGLVYAETPFLQQVHAGCHDFTRFTPLGHRALFRGFAEVDSGLVAGPGIALAWAWRHLLMSLGGSPRSRALLGALAALTGFPLRALDRWVRHRPFALDGASCCYFLGQRSETVLTGRELLRQYRGAGPGAAAEAP